MSDSNTTARIVPEQKEEQTVDEGLLKGEADLVGKLEDAAKQSRFLSAQDAERMRNSKRAAGIAAGIADTVSALGNMYFSTQGAPSVYDHTKGMSAASAARWDKTIAERQAESDRHMAYLQQAQSIRSAADLRERQRAIEAAKLKREEQKMDLAQAKDERDAALAEIRMQLDLKKIDATEAEARYTDVKREYAERTGYIMGVMPKPKSGAAGSGRNANKTFTDRQKAWIIGKCRAKGINYKEQDRFDRNKFRYYPYSDLYSQLVEALTEEEWGTWPSGQEAAESATPPTTVKKASPTAAGKKASPTAGN